MSVQIYTGQLVVQECYLCSMTFGVPASFDRERLEDHGNFYCPAGHSQHYIGKTEVQKQRERADQLERRLANREEDLRSERASHQMTEHRRRAAKGQLTKTKNRVANGVCPCCNRTFADLGRHMAGQHPEYAEATK